jgi:hypothetical protein
MHFTFQVIVGLLQNSLNKPFNKCNKIWPMLKVAGDLQLSSIPIKYMAYVMHLGSMFIINCNNILHVLDAICVHPQEHLKTVVTASGV